MALGEERGYREHLPDVLGNYGRAIEAGHAHVLQASRGWGEGDRSTRLQIWHAVEVLAIWVRAVEAGHAHVLQASALPRLTRVCFSQRRSDPACSSRAGVYC